MDGLRIDFGDTFTVTKDYDGYPAVRARNTAWVEGDRWVTASGYHADLERNVRDLAAALVKMADAMQGERKERV